MNKNFNVIILTEGGKDIGIGHITRCTSLYQAFEDKGIIPVFILNGDEISEKLLNGKKNTIYNWLNDKKRLFSDLADSDIVIVDSYLADFDLYDRISKCISLPVYIDDNKRLEYPPGTVVNGSVNAEKLNYSRKDGIEYLLGTRYTPLRKEFWSVPQKSIKEKIGSIMITFGGDDIRDLTPKVLKLLTEYYPEVVKKVIIGQGLKNREEIGRLKDVKTELIIHPNAEGMKRVMMESDIAISAGGQTLYELARVGVPAIAVTVADNQLNNVNGWEREGFIIDAGWWHDTSVLENIGRGIQLLQGRDVRRERSTAGKNIVDGLGAIRTVRYCIRKCIEDTITLRSAVWDDMLAIYELSNEQEVRQNSFSQEGITFEEHKKWFEHKLSDANCLFLVAETGVDFIGQVRFDINGEEAVVSISISKACRGFGFGCDILQKALRYLKMKRQNLKAVNAYVKEGNTSSSKLFEKSGFKFAKRITIRIK